MDQSPQKPYCKHYLLYCVSCYSFHCPCLASLEISFTLGTAVQFWYCPHCKHAHRIVLDNDKLFVSGEPGPQNVKEYRVKDVTTYVFRDTCSYYCNNLK